MFYHHSIYRGFASFKRRARIKDEGKKSTINMNKYRGFRPGLQQTREKSEVKGSTALVKNAERIPHFNGRCRWMGKL